MVSLLIWALNQIKIITAENLCGLSSVWSVCLLLIEREALMSQSATIQLLQLLLKPFHTVTCGEVWSGNKTNHPVRFLSSMWGRCIDSRALLLHCIKQRRTHYTIPLGAILIELSLSRTVWLKGLVLIQAVANVIHYHIENETIWFPLSSHSTSVMLRHDVDSDDCCVRWQIFRSKAKVCVCCTKQEIHPSGRIAQETNIPHQHKPCVLEKCNTECA